MALQGWVLIEEQLNCLDMLCIYYPIINLVMLLYDYIFGEINAKWKFTLIFFSFYSLKAPSDDLLICFTLFYKLKSVT